MATGPIDHAAIDASVATFRQVLARMEAALRRRPWLADASFTLADVAAAAFVDHVEALRMEWLWDNCRGWPTGGRGCRHGRIRPGRAARPAAHAAPSRRRGARFCASGSRRTWLDRARAADGAGTTVDSSVPWLKNPDRLAMSASRCASCAAGERPAM